MQAGIFLETVDVEKLRLMGKVCAPLVSESNVWTIAEPIASGKFSSDMAHYSIPSLPPLIALNMAKGKGMSYVEVDECVAKRGYQVCPSHAFSSSPGKGFCSVPPPHSDECYCNVAPASSDFFRKAHIGGASFIVPTKAKSYQVHNPVRLNKAAKRANFTHSHPVDKPINIYWPKVGTVLNFGCLGCSVTGLVVEEGEWWQTEPLPEASYLDISSEVARDSEGEKESIRLIAYMDQEEATLHKIGKTFRLGTDPLNIMSFLSFFAHGTNYLLLVGAVIVFWACKRSRNVRFVHRDL
jgi:hypothetical protein